MQMAVGDHLNTLLDDLSTLADIASAGVLSRTESRLQAGEVRPAAILFVDVVGFTSLSRSLTPEQLAKLIDRTFRIFELTAKSFGGYLDKAHNRGIWPREGWLNTGDLGRRDADGYFWLTGRTKELIIRGGHNIDPAAIEDPLYRLPGIQVAAAVGRPDPHAGEVPVAYVQLQDDAALTSDQIMEYLNAQIGERAAVPKEISIVDEIPLTPVGKIFKPALRWQAIQKVYRKELEALGDLVESVDVTVGEDKIHGALAVITIKARPDISIEEIKRKADDILARFTVKYQLEVA